MGSENTALGKDFILFSDVINNQIVLGHICNFKCGISPITRFVFCVGACVLAQPVQQITSCANSTGKRLSETKFKLSPS